MNNDDIHGLLADTCKRLSEQLVDLTFFAALDDVESLQAHLDSFMQEYCPWAITKEQWVQYRKSQTPSGDQRDD